MNYFVKNITTAEWVAKKAFYVPIGMESFEDGTTVQIRNGIGEFSKVELEEIKAQAESQVTKYNEMLAYFA